MPLLPFFAFPWVSASLLPTASDQDVFPLCGPSSACLLFSSERCHLCMSAPRSAAAYIRLLHTGKSVAACASFLSLLRRTSWRRLLRAIVSIVFSVLFVSSLDVFLVGVACIPSPTGADEWILYNFPSMKCYNMPHMVHALIGIVM